MNNLLFSFLVLSVWCFRRVANPLIRKGRVKEGFCVLWFVNCIFSLCGTILSFYLYQYRIPPIFNLRNLFFLFAFATIGTTIILLAPSGHRLFTKKSTLSEEEMLLCEYHFHEIAYLTCHFFLFLLFCIPVLLAFLEGIQMHLPQTLHNMLGFFVKNEIYGGFCFFAFLILLPLSLRQTLYWLKSLKVPTSDAELIQQHIYSARLRYQKRNRLL